MNPATVGIAGTGLIGASIGLRARQIGLRVLGHDFDPGALAAAIERDAIDEAVPLDRLYARSGIVVLAMPLQAVVAELRRIESGPASGAALLMDVASVKAPIVAAARNLRGFVGTHPMTGKARSGASEAEAGLFAGKAWAYVPSSDEEVTRGAREFIEALGGAPVEIDAETHDAIAAFTSHMPQVFASLFAERYAQFRQSYADALCGPVARELLRIGESRPAFWADVLEGNAGNVEREIRAMACALLRLCRAHMRNTP